MPPVHDSAVASVQPRARQRSSTISSIPALVLREQVPREPVAERARRAPSGRARTGRRGSRSPARRSSRSTPCGSPPASVSARATSDSLAPKKRRTRCSGGSARASTRLTGIRLERPRPEPLQLRAAGPGRTTTTASRARRTSPGAVPARPSETAPSGSVACLRTPASKSAYGRLRRSATAREMPSICVSQPLVDVQRRARPRARPAPPCGRRASARGRPRRRTDRPRARRRTPPRARAASSPTIVIDAGSSPSRTSSRARNGPLRSVRSPRTSSLPVMTRALRRRKDAARGDDERLRLAAGIRDAPGRSTTMRRFPGVPVLIQSRWRVKCFVSPGASSLPWSRMLARSARRCAPRAATRCRAPPAASRARASGCAAPPSCACFGFGFGVVSVEIPATGWSGGEPPVQATITSAVTTRCRAASR